MAYFLAFLVLATIVVPMARLSRLGELALALVFALTLILGATATIHHRVATLVVIGLTTLTFAVNVTRELAPSHGLVALGTALKLACLAILVFMTLKRTLRPGPVTGYRIIGGIAGYLLIGYMWAFAYQLLVYKSPHAIQVDGAAVTDCLSQQPNDLIYFSFITLATVGYGDMHPINPAVRSLAVAEALVGQLYVAILISSLVGMALHDKPTNDGFQ